MKTWNTPEFTILDIKETAGNGKGHGNSNGKGHDSHGNGNGYGHIKNDCQVCNPFAPSPSPSTNPSTSDFS